MPVPSFEQNAETIMMAEMAPEPDYDAVLRQEYQAALNEGSSAALIRFIARHPDSPLADEGRRILSGRSNAEPPLNGDPDAGVIAAFDAARRSGDPDVLRAFAKRYSGHPLADEARRLIERLAP